MKRFSAVNRYIVKYATLAVFILIVFSLLLPAGYNSYITEDFFTYFWVAASLSCNPPAVLVSMVIILFLLIFSTKKFIRIHHSFIIFLLIGTVLLSAGVYFINFLKSEFPKPRPFHEFLSSRNLLRENLENFTQLSDTQRKLELSSDSLIQKIPDGVSPIVYKIWLAEPALSFPSAHAFNSVFIGIVYSCILFFTIQNKKIKKIYFAPLIWMIFVSVSRIVLGFHHKTDVIFGSLMGYCAALLFVYSGALNKIIFINRGKDAA